MKVLRIPYAVVLLVALAACSGDDVTSPDDPSSIEVEITTDKASYQIGDPVTIRLKNVSSRTVHVYDSCPPYLQKEAAEDWEYHSICNCACPAIPPRTSPLEPGASITVDISAETSLEYIDAGTYRKHWRLAREAMGTPEDFYSEPFPVGP